MDIDTLRATLGGKAKRVEHIGDCRLILGDCLEVMPLLGKVDAVVTDPPYGIGSKMQGGTWGAKGNYAKMREWDMTTNQPAFDYFVNLGVPVISWGGNYYQVPPSRCWLTWAKRDNMPTMSDFELAWTNLDKNSKEFYHRRSCFDRQHQTGKPVALMKWCLGFLPDAETILDPFMGSGTTLVACAKLGRKGIGIELDPDYFEIACKRVQQAYDQPDLFVEPPKQPHQEGMDL